MSLHVGIVGLPNVGKSTLFQALTKKRVDTSNYPFATIDPNVGVVAVPDERLGRLSAFSASARTIPTTIEFTDIAGLVKGASRGEGLGNTFLEHIRQVDAIVHVVRGFSDTNVIHVAGKIDPAGDQTTILYELAMADMDHVNRALTVAEGKSKAGDAEAIKQTALLKKIKARLDAGEPASGVPMEEDDAAFIKPLNLLTMKPMLTMLNVDESDVRESPGELRLSVKIESEIAGLEPADAQAFLDDLGWKQSGLDRLITASYSLLGLITFFTTGEDETRAWTIHKGDKAPRAAGVIHSDFEEKFIRAEVVQWQTLIASGSWNGAKDKGLIRLEGKAYEFQDGDVAVFHHS